MRLATCLLLVAVSGCERRAKIDAGTARAAPEIPWQPHGFRAPTLTCELTVPEGLKRNTPMPDHLVELMSVELPPKTIIIVSERVEQTVAAAVERVRAYHASRPVTEEALDGGTLINVPGEDGAYQGVVLLSLPGLPLVEVIGRFADERGRAQLLELAASLRCSKK